VECLKRGGQGHVGPTSQADFRLKTRVRGELIQCSEGRYSRREQDVGDVADGAGSMAEARSRHRPRSCCMVIKNSAERRGAMKSIVLAAGMMSLVLLPSHKLCLVFRAMTGRAPSGACGGRKAHRLGPFFKGWRGTPSSPMSAVGFTRIRHVVTEISLHHSSRWQHQSNRLRPRSAYAYMARRLALGTVTTKRVKALS
jgi:hypothetical protein